MRIQDAFKHKSVVYSMEVFPPKPTSDISVVYQALDQLKTLAPDFISVTYGAGASGGNSRTRQVASYIKDNCGIAPLAHLTCMGASRAQVDALLQDLRAHGIESVLALRGDRYEGCPQGAFAYAAQLIAYIKETAPDFQISAACYPETHIDCPSVKEDMRHLKEKVDAGATHLISQLFFDNRYFYEFQQRAAGCGIDVPIEAGIMPVVNASQIKRITSLCGATLPAKFLRAMTRYDDPQAMRDCGIAYACEQILDLLASGVRGIHLYTMNNPYVAIRITQSVRRALESLNKRG
nr:methylenetetrahydrofolate reductase [NAD(P)H] [Maliibacterium massiliense]